MSPTVIVASAFEMASVTYTTTLYPSPDLFPGPAVFPWVDEPGSPEREVLRGPDPEHR